MGLKASAATSPRVLEIGFGTGLNALLTLETAERERRPVHYTGIELYPLSWEEVDALHYSDNPLFEMLHTAPWGEDVNITPYFTLHKIQGDANTVLNEKFLVSRNKFQKASEEFLTVSEELLDDSEEFLDECEELLADSQEFLAMSQDLLAISRMLPVRYYFDVVYFDAFAPEKQPEMWSEELLRNLYDVLRNHGVLTTYCAKGTVRRLLEEVGFTVERLPGPPGGKREILRASKNNDFTELHISEHIEEDR